MTLPDPAVVWLTGLPAAGKSTLARALVRALGAQGMTGVLLDGDELRRGLCQDLGFGAADRRENVRRVGEVARLLVEAGLFAVVALVSPYRADRDAVRARVAPGTFVEVFVQCDLATCEARDPKGMYKQARAGLLTNFTGIDAPYEAPRQPELIVDTRSTSVDACVAQLMEAVRARHTVTA